MINPESISSVTKLRNPKGNPKFTLFFRSFYFPLEEIMREGYHITEMAFWNPDPENPDHIIRTGRPKDDETGVSEFPHLIVNQARVLDYFAEAAARYRNATPDTVKWGARIEDDDQVMALIPVSAVTQRIDEAMAEGRA